jgi:hypothetical protein
LFFPRVFFLPPHIHSSTNVFPRSPVPPFPPSPLPILLPFTPKTQNPKPNTQNPQVARIKSDGRVITFVTQPSAAKLAYTDDTNASKVHVVDLSSGSLNDVASVGALEVSFPVKHLAFSLDGTLLLTVGASSATLWRWEEGTAVQHESLDASEVGVGAAFCPGLETPTFIVAGTTAARFIQLADDSDPVGGGRGKLHTTRVVIPATGASSPAITSFCWSRKGLWLGLRGRALTLGLARLEGPGSVGAVQVVSTPGCFGDERTVITQLEGCLDGGCVVAVNGGAKCFWVSADAKVVAEATLGDDARSIAMPPGAGATTGKNLFLVASLKTSGAFAKVPAWPAANKTNLTGDVEYFNASAGAGVVDIARSAATLNQVPGLVEVQTLLNRVPSLKQLVKVPSLKELNARVTMIPPGASTAAAAAVAMPPPPPVATAALGASAAGAASNGVDADGNPAPCPGKVCANCRTQKTPLWRNGPLGPKTLCNACGVRYKLGKLPPPGGFPPGHVPPPAPPRKRPALLTANGNPLKRQKGDKKANGPGAKNAKGPGGGAEKKKSRGPARPNPAGGPAGHTFDGDGGLHVRGGKLDRKGGGVLTDYDGAVLLMVLAGLYNH